MWAVCEDTLEDMHVSVRLGMAPHTVLKMERERLTRLREMGLVGIETQVNRAVNMFDALVSERVNVRLY